jgi:hypothetical protein
MNKISRLYVITVLLAMTNQAIFANYPTNSPEESDKEEIQNEIDNSNPEEIGDRSWETTSSRMNRQATATSNIRSNPIQNRDEQTEDRSWETTSSRMNRQAAAAANNRDGSTWIRNGQIWIRTDQIRTNQNRDDSNSANRRNVRR